MTDEVLCPNCGKQIKTKRYFKSFWHWEDEREYYYPTSKGECKTCHIKYDGGEFTIPNELKPTEKQKKTVMFIRNSLNIPYGEEGITKHTYWEFINRYFDKAKTLHNEQGYFDDGICDPTYINDIIDCSDLGIFPWGNS